MRKLVVGFLAVFGLASCSVDNDNSTIRNADAPLKLMSEENALGDLHRLVFRTTETDPEVLLDYVVDIDKITEWLMVMDVGKCYTNPFTPNVKEVECPDDDRDS